MSNVDYVSYEATVKQSERLEKAIRRDPTSFRVLTGDRPTGRLHIGHLFGSLGNRVRRQNLNVPIFIVIADYQVLTDRDHADNIADNVFHLVIDYFAAGLNPEKCRTFIFPHRHVPELNQMIIPFQ